MGKQPERTGTECGLEWRVLGARLGHRCGYVRVPPGHPLHGVDHRSPAPGVTWDAIKDQPIGKRGPMPVFIVHGSVTFTGEMRDDADGWWIGFDCGHPGDAPDPDLLDDETLRLMCRDGEVRSADYVEAECRSLARQIDRLFHGDDYDENTGIGIYLGDDDPPDGEEGS